MREANQSGGRPSAIAQTLGEGLGPANGRHVRAVGRPETDVEHLLDVSRRAALAERRLEVLGAHGLVAVGVVVRHRRACLVFKR
eukprot:scaffold8232_cov31-Tisochrysis_lutea.AAC.2